MFFFDKRKTMLYYLWNGDFIFAAGICFAG